jgi:hypothetical protein
MKMLTAKWLEDQGACPASLRRFRQMFGDECQVNEANARRWLKDEINFWYTESSARHDIAWLVLRLVGRRRDGHCGFFSMPIAERVLRHLGLKLRADKAYYVMDGVSTLPECRLTKAIEQIAAQSPNI